MRRLLLAAALAGAGCIDVERPIGSNGDGGAPPVDGAGSDWAYISVVMKDKVDLLFMVDNSASMTAMSDELKARFSQFIQPLSDLAARGIYPDLHIGVVTSDYGAGATGAPGCQPSPGGQNGQLQAIGQYADPSCKAPVGAAFASYRFTADGSNPNNLPPGQDLVATFTCMASVGGFGCGFEHQLESVYAALHNELPANAGFLRNDALLVVVFLTNEDDSSAPPDTDMFDKNAVAMFGFEDSYRQTRFGVMCCPPGAATCDATQKQLTPYGDSAGPLTGCQAATNPPGFEYEVSRYVDFFTLPSSQGGVKADPNDVVLIAIDAPPDPVQIILSNPGTPAGMPYVPCGFINEASNPPCVPVLQHSCQNPQEPQFFGDPAVRLNTVVEAARHHAIFSICDTDYTSALQGIANLVVVTIGDGCIANALPDLANAQCTVEDVTENSDGTQTTSELSRCASQPSYPCWRLEAKPACEGVSPQGVGITVDRGGQAPPPNTVSRFRCQ